MDNLHAIPVEDSLERPHIFSYLDYRQFLADMVEFLRKKQKYSVRAFARSAGFGSSNYLHLIIIGKRNLTGRFVRTVGLTLELNALEQKFFETLVKYEKASDLHDKDSLLVALMKFKQSRPLKRVTPKQYEIFKDWRMVALYEGLGCLWAHKSSAQKAHDLGVSEEVLEAFYMSLHNLDLIRQENGVWIRKEFAIDTEPFALAAILRSYHKQMIERAAQSIDDYSAHLRSVGALTLPLTTNTYQLIERRLTELRAEIASLHADEKSAEVVYQLNIQLFPLLGMIKE